MYSAVKLTVAGLATVALLSACSATPAEFETTVELKNASADCDLDPNCWLPTQFDAYLVGGQSVSLFDEWPSKGDTVKVVCEAVGEKLVDSTGKASTRWFGILVPTDKVNTDVPAKKIEGGYLGYVSALWLADKQATAPEC